MLDINSRDEGEITVLELSGTLVVGLGLETLRQRIQQLVAEQRLNIVLNVKKVLLIDSSGVGDLVAGYSSVKRSGGSLKIANPTKIVRDVLHITRITAIIEIYDTEEAALKACAQ